MTNKPITDPAEIAKLPDGWWRTEGGLVFEKALSSFYLGGKDDLSAAYTAEDVADYGGIADRLVPESDSNLSQHAIECIAEVEAERDRALELLREVLLQTNDAWWHKDMCERIQRFLAKHPETNDG